MAKARQDPSDRLGVYKRLDDVPARYRLGNYDAEFRGRDTWGEFFESRAADVGGDLSESQAWKYERCGRVWKAFMDDEGRPHALADPDHIEAFVSDLAADLTTSSTYETYFGPLTVFYGWLWTHTEYPHVYSPVLMAAETGGVARDQWEYRMDIN